MKTSRAARKRVLVGSVKRRGRAVLAIGLAGLMIATTACGAPAEYVPAGPSIAGGEVIKTDKGEYLQSTIADDDPAMTYDPTTALGKPTDYLSLEQIEKGQKFAVKFIAEEVIDSPLNHNASSVDDWWSINANKFEIGRAHV